MASCLTLPCLVRGHPVLAKSSPWRLGPPDGAAVLALADEQDALRKRADFKHLTRLKVGAGRLLAPARPLGKPLPLTGPATPTVRKSAPGRDPVRQPGRGGTRAGGQPPPAPLNKERGQRLGLPGDAKGPETGGSYLPSRHDMPDRVAALVQEGRSGPRWPTYKPAVDIDLRERSATSGPCVRCWASPRRRGPPASAPTLRRCTRT